MTLVESTDSSKRLPLGIIFDIDGTLIAEGRHIHHVLPRPGAVEFLQWCRERGHAVALWTAAHTLWADTVAADLCPKVTKDHAPHECGYHCRKTFDFIWGGDKQRTRSQVRVSCYAVDDECRWCGPYRFRCNRCNCSSGAAYCACRHTKDLRRVFYNDDKETASFTRERTLIVENTPQKCIDNYGNAIYVPTYGGPTDPAFHQGLFERLKNLVRQLETVNHVRQFRKCNHRQGPHACFEQSWLTENELVCIPIEAERKES